VAVQRAPTQANTTPDMPDGWSGEWEPTRAKATIDRLRPFERQLNQLRSDPDAFAQFAAELGYEFDNGEQQDEPVWEPDTQDDEPFQPQDDPRLTKVEQQLLDIERERQAGYVNGHISELAAEAGVELSKREQDRLFKNAYAGENSGPALTKQAFDDYLELRKELQEEAVNGYRKSKRAPAPPQPGKAGEPKANLKSTKERVDAMAARIAQDE
jgi:hypothetical protein